MNEQTTDTYAPVAPTHSNMFMRLYHGEYSLARTFWFFCVLVPVAAAAIFSVSVTGVLLSFGSQESAAALTGPIEVLITLVAIYVSMAVYSVFAYVGLWRAATKYRGIALWAFAAKAFVVLGILGFLVNIYGAFTLFLGE